MREAPPKLASTDWVDLAERFSLKHYAAITAPEMLWRYGLGPRPNNLEDWIATVGDLDNTRPFQVISDPNPKTAVPSKTSGKEADTQSTPEEGGEENIEPLRRHPDHATSTRPRSSSSEPAPLEAVPLRQVPFVPPPLGNVFAIF